MKIKKILYTIAGILSVSLCIGITVFAVQDNKNEGWINDDSFDISKVTVDNNFNLRADYNKDENCVYLNWGANDEANTEDTAEGKKEDLTKEYKVFAKAIEGVDDPSIKTGKYQPIPVEGTINVLNLYPGIYDHKDKNGNHNKYMDTNRLEQWMREPAMIKMVDQNSDDYHVTLDLRVADNGKTEPVKYQYVILSQKEYANEIIAEFQTNGKGVVEGKIPKYTENIEETLTIDDVDNPGQKKYITVKRNIGEVKRYTKEVVDENGRKHKPNDIIVNFPISKTDFRCKDKVEKIEKDNLSDDDKYFYYELKDVERDSNGIYKEGENYKTPMINVIAKDARTFENDEKMINYLKERRKYADGDRTKELKDIEKENPLKDEDGKYDVIVYGTWDVNNGVVPSNDIVDFVYKDYIDSGRGFLAGHDTLGYTNGTQLGLGRIRDEFKIKVSNGDFPLLPNPKIPSQKDIPIINNDGKKPPRGSDEGYENINYGLLGYKVEVAKKGVLTNYPWHISDERTKLDVPASHSTNNFSCGGDIWFTYGDIKEDKIKEMTSATSAPVSDDIKNQSNFYLTTYNSTAMIQTGHSLGDASPDEEKLFANTIHYLHQLTARTSTKDYSCQDYAAPNSPEITSLGNGEVELNVFKDKGTTYEYVVQKHDLKDYTYKVSPKKKVYICSGIRGYLIYTDGEYNTDIKKYIENLGNDNKNLDKESLQSNGIQIVESQQEEGKINCKLENYNNNKYVHLAAIDNNGNISGTVTAINIIDIEAKEINVAKDDEVWADVTLNNINDKNKSFEINNLDDILGQEIVIEYDKDILKYTGACTLNHSFRIVNEIVDEDNGVIKFNIKCRKIEPNEQFKNNMFSLSFDPIKEDKAELIVSKASIIDKDNKYSELTEIQRGRTKVNIEG